MQEVTRTFRAMNTEVQLRILAGDVEEAQQYIQQVVALFGAVERRLSRFLPDSELWALNAAAGRPFRASKMLFDVVQAAVAAARVTDGIFDPTVLPSLMAAGYDRSFELLTGSQDQEATLSTVSKAGCWRDIRMDPDTNTITLPPGSAIDLGGIGKGWAVDRAVEILSDWVSFGIDAGGDLYVGGSKQGRPWLISVVNPRFPNRDLLTLGLEERAVATSSIMQRRWLRGGEVMHHIIDPRTGLPAQTHVVSATVIDDSVTRAEVLAKSAIILGEERGIQLIEDAGADGVLVLANNDYIMTTNLSEMVYG